MPTGWTRKRWGDLIELCYGQSMETRDGHPRFRVYGTDGPIGWSTEYLCPHPGVIIGRKGAYRGVHYSRLPFWVIDTAFYVEPRTECDLRWVYYALQTVDIDRLDSGSAIPSTSRDDVYAVPVHVPPVLEQQVIAGTLGRLDDKIELNLQMNETLEALARAVFEQRVMAPARESLPDGWTRATLGEHLDIVRGLSYKGSGLVKEGGLPLHNLDSVKEGGGYKRSGIKRYTGEYRERHLVRPGEVVVANTEQGHDELLIGCPAIVPRAFGEFGLFSQDLSRVVPKADSPLTPRFVYLLLANERVRRTVAAYANGTTVNHLPREALERPTFPLPPPAVIAEVDALVAPLLERIEANEDENATLTELRDALLPGLVSGRIRVDGVREPD